MPPRALGWSPEQPAHPAVIAALIAVCIALPALHNGFALDDVYVIVKNPRVHSLDTPWLFLLQTYWPPDRGAALYRPLTILVFAIQWAIGGGAPLVYHLVSMLLFAGVSALVAALILVLGLGRRAAVIGGVLFVVHPVHVEAVANVVGQSELLASLAVLGAMLIYLRGRRRGTLTATESATVAVLYGAGCLSKEHATVLPALIVLIELACFPSVPLRERLRAGGPALLGMLVVAVAFWTTRTVVLGGVQGVDTHPVFRGASAMARMLTCLGLVGTWMRLLLFPLQLRADYSPADYQLARGFGPSQAVGSLLLLMVGITVWRCWRHRPMISVGMLFTVIALLPISNLLVATGVLVAERTLFLPSVGAILLVAAAFEPWLRGPRWQPATILLAGLALLGGVRSMLRAPVWASTEELSHHMLDDAPRDYRSWWMVGGFAVDQGDSTEGEAAYRKAVELYEGDPELLVALGNLELVRRQYGAAETMYRKTLALVPEYEVARNRRILALVGLGRCADARAEAERAAQFGDPSWRARVAFVDSVAASPTAHCDAMPARPAPR